MKHKKTIILAASLLAAILTVSGITLALLTDSTEPIENTFIPTGVPIEVVETFENNVKSNVRIKNLGETSAYIRAAIVVNWVDSTGNILGTKPILNADYEMNLSDKWAICGDYYYWTEPVPAEDETGVLINTCQVLQNAPTEGYTLQVEILAQSVQSEPEQAIEDLWGVTIQGGSVTEIQQGGN